MKIHWTKVNDIVDETSDVKTFYLDQPEDFTWVEGSFTHLAMKGFNEGEQPNRNLVRHMSIMTLPHEQTIGITTRIKEQCSEYKRILKNLTIGDEVALFRTFTNVPLKREHKNIYLLSQGVGLATFRPLALAYLNQPDGIKHIHSLNIDSSREFLFTDIFQSTSEKNFTSQFVDNRNTYYNEVKKLAKDQDSLFYIVGSDEFLKDNIAFLYQQGISEKQIMLDKHEQELPEFLSLQPTK